MNNWYTCTSDISEVPRLKEIWKLAFGDEDAYIDRFFELYYRPERVMTLHAEDAIPSAIHTFDMRAIVMPDGSEFSAGVTYALGTDPKYRGHDYGMKCMDAALAMQAQMGRDCSIQVPANDTLFVQYHKRIGYCDAFYVKEAHIPCTDIGTADGEIVRVGWQRYGELRESLLDGLCHVAFDDEGLRYQEVLCQDADGGLYELSVNGYTGCATVELLPEDTVFVKELLIDDSVIKEALAVIAEQYPGRDYIVRTPSDRGDPLGGEVRRFAMAKFFGEKAGYTLDRSLNAYFGLAYD